jgi:hypothetical protein
MRFCGSTGYRKTADVTFGICFRRIRESAIEILAGLELKTFGLFKIK